MTSIFVPLASAFVVALSAMACSSPYSAAPAPNKEEDLTKKDKKSPAKAPPDVGPPLKETPTKSPTPDKKKGEEKGEEKGEAGGKDGGKAGDELQAPTKEELACMDRCVSSDAKAKSILAAMDACLFKCGPEDKACATKCNEEVETSCEDEDAQASCNKLFDECFPKCFPRAGADDTTP